jgi:outer membrane protein assembly factor BamB
VTGEENFNYFFRSRSFESVNAATPLVIQDQILLSAAYRTGVALLRVKESGKDFDVIWKNRNLETHWSTPVPLEGHVVGFSGRHENEAMFRCIDLKRGEIAWETDGLPKTDGKPASATADAFYGRGSAILADGKLIVLGERGVLALVAADPRTFTEISRVKFPKMVYPSWAAPILSRGRLYLRCEGYLTCLDLKKPNR